jgi:hypothetical protein
MSKMNDQQNVSMPPIIIEHVALPSTPPNQSSDESDKDNTETVTRNFASLSDESVKKMFDITETHGERELIAAFENTRRVCSQNVFQHFSHSRDNVSHDSDNNSVNSNTHMKRAAHSSGNNSASNVSHDENSENDDSLDLRKFWHSPQEKSRKKTTVAELNKKFKGMSNYLRTTEARRKSDKKAKLAERRKEQDMLINAIANSSNSVNQKISEAAQKTQRATEQLIGKVMTEFSGVKNRLIIVEDEQTVMKGELTELHRTQANTDNALSHMHEKINKTEKHIDHVHGLTNRVETTMDELSRHMSQLNVRVSNCERRVLTMNEPVSENRDNSPERRRDLFSVRDIPTINEVNNFSDIHISHISRRAVHSRSNSHSSKSSSAGSETKKIKNASSDDFISKLIDHLQNGSIKFPSYSGDIDIDNYKKQCNIIATQNNWSDQILATQIVANLKGDARKLLSLMPKGQETDLNAVWLTLSCNSPKNEVSERAKNLLNNYRQLKGQSLLKLALEIKRLASEAYPNTDQATRDELAVDAFTKAIHNHQIRFQLRISVVKTVDEARVLAEKIESAFTSDRAVTLYHVKEKSHSQPNSEYETDSEQVENSALRKRKSIDNFETKNKKHSTSNMINEQKESARNTLVNSSTNSQLSSHMNVSQMNSSQYNSPHKNTEQYSGLDWQSPRRVNFSFPSYPNSSNSSGNHRNGYHYNYNHYSRGNNWRYRNNRGRRFYSPYCARDSNYDYPQNSHFRRNFQDRRNDSYNGSRENLSRQSNERNYYPGNRRNAGAAVLNEQRQQN